jgi:sterol desaturase/sphingolipid hydroxylase (fatty acid hydroxylase superfamily)
VDTTAYYALGFPLYIGVFGLECIVARVRGRDVRATTAASVSNIAVALGAIVVAMAVGPVIVWTYDLSYRYVALFDWSGLSWWVPFTVAVVLGDHANYWRHRAEHRFAALWAVHHVHHTPTEMNLSVGLRHAWLSDTYALPFYFALPLIGIPPLQFFLAMVGITLYGVFLHSREYTWPSLWILITPRAHRIHHAKDARYADKNFAALFTLWDRMYGTYAAPDVSDSLRFGTSRGSETHCGARAQLALLVELTRKIAQARGVRSKLAAMFARPDPTVRVEPASSAPLGRAAQIYLVVQLGLLVAFSSYVFRIDVRPEVGWIQGGRAWVALGAAVILITIVSLGLVLDRAQHARRFELARCALGAPAAIAVIVATWSPT